MSMAVPVMAAIGFDLGLQHGDAVVGREQRLLGIVYADADDELVDEPAGARDDVGVPERHGVERSGIEAERFMAGGGLELQGRPSYRVRTASNNCLSHRRKQMRCGRPLHAVGYRPRCGPSARGCNGRAPAPSTRVGAAWLKDCEGAATCRLGAVERQIDVAHQLFRGGAMLRGKNDADAAPIVSSCPSMRRGTRIAASNRRVISSASATV